MLVLSRGRNDKVVFPTLGISVEILRVAGNKVRLGIEAPQEIPVHRHEVSERMAANESSAAGVSEPGRNAIIKMPAAKNSTTAQMNHAIRNRLQAAALGLHLLHHKLESDDLSDAEATIFTIFNELKAIEIELEPATGAGVSDPGYKNDLSYKSDPGHREPIHRALVVEDNDNERELLAGYLRVSGFDVDTAADGLQAMVRLTEHAPDVVLLDMLMPRFDGRKTISAIRNNPDYRGMKLFAVSGTRPEDMNVTLGPGGVDRWFTKPVDPKRLLEALRAELHVERVLA
ncbi:MAG: response regulator [Planctomycetes bacterium]|nr:response regulator [Planctomycetota bacterium]